MRINEDAIKEKIGNAKKIIIIKHIKIKNNIHLSEKTLKECSSHSFAYHKFAHTTILINNLL